MFIELFSKFNAFADHHQIIFTIIVGLCIVCVTWAFEQILDRYVFPKKPLIGYLILIVIGLSVLWLTKHFILHVI